MWSISSYPARMGFQSQLLTPIQARHGQKDIEMFILTNSSDMVTMISWAGRGYQQN